MAGGFKVVETDNYGRDYPNEKFATPYIFRNSGEAEAVAKTLNDIFCSTGNEDRYWKVVPEDYRLQPGFEP